MTILPVIFGICYKISVSSLTILTNRLIIQVYVLAAVKMIYLNFESRFYKKENTMKILLSPVSNDVHDAELKAVQDICALDQPDRVILCFPDGFSVETMPETAKETLLALKNSFDIMVTYSDPEKPESVAAYLKELRADHPDDVIIVNTLGGSAEEQAAILPLASDDTMQIILTDGSAPAAIPETTSALANASDVSDVTAADPEPDAQPEEAPVKSAPAQPDPDTIKKEAVTEFGKALLSELVDSYDYHGALVLSRKLGGDVPEIVPFLLEAADMRADGRFAESNQMFRRCGLEGIMTGQQSIAEYYLLLDLYVKQERYTDFLRALQPFLLEIMIAAIRKQFNMDITRYMIYGSRRWDENKLVLEQMTGKFNETFTYHTKPKPTKAGGYVTTAHLSNLMENLSVQRQHATMILDTLKLRLNAEERVRTLASYNLQGVTAQDIEKACACRPEDILTMLLNYVRNYTDITLTDEMVSSYCVCQVESA